MPAPEKSTATVRGTAPRGEVVSKPGATLEVTLIEIPAVYQNAITRGLQEGRAEARRLRGQTK